MTQDADGWELDGPRLRLLRNMRSADFAGHDPFDGLNSPLTRWMGLTNSRIGRLAWLQLLKRLPVNIRVATGVPKTRSSKGVALVILGLVRDFRRNGDTALLDEAVVLADWLIRARVGFERLGFGGWGYPFDWQSRAFFVDRFTPNAICTAYACRALLALEGELGEQRFDPVMEDVGAGLERVFFDSTGGAPYFRYVPDSPALVHNANLWAAATSALLATRVPSSGLADAAAAAAETSALAQRQDGSWPYGSRAHHGFTDSFHTGYNLEALEICRTQLPQPSLAEPIRKGLAHFRRDFLMRSGAVKYYVDRAYPYDTHAIAQAIVTLVQVGGTRDDVAMAERIGAWSVRNLYDPKSGWFVYQAGRLIKNRIVYLRWTQAWAYYALAVLLHRLSLSDPEN